jgi:hypothetical protein
MGHAIKPILKKKVTERRPEFKEDPQEEGHGGNDAVHKIRSSGWNSIKNLHCP